MIPEVRRMRAVGLVVIAVNVFILVFNVVRLSGWLAWLLVVVNVFVICVAVRATWAFHQFIRGQR